MGYLREQIEVTESNPRRQQCVTIVSGHKMHQRLVCSLDHPNQTYNCLRNFHGESSMSMSAHQVHG